jgi:copper homeostasis protein
MALVLPLFEQCVDALPIAYEAIQRGADRLELCSRLDLDGLSPEPAHLDELLGATTIPLFAMVRPRAGDFRCSPSEVASMLIEIERLKLQGAHGVVLGALDKAGRVNRRATAELVECAAPLPVTFHRAFDATPNALEALEELIGLGVTRILTSGQAANALAGHACLEELVRRAGDRLTILAGGGVRPDNVSEIVRRTGVTEVHASVPLDLLRGTSQP